MPFRRSYSLEEIGYVPRGASLNFDRFGRVAVIHDGIYAVLNDTSWLNISGHETDRVAVLSVVTAPDGTMYYGGRASWGVAEIQSDGLLHARPLAPADSPEWVRSATFDQLFITKDGVYFTGANGVVYWDFRTKTTQFYKEPRIWHCFNVGDRIYISAFDKSLRYINPARSTLEIVPPTRLDSEVVDNATPLDDGHVLLFLVGGKFVVFDGVETIPWAPQSQYHLEGPISALQHLVDGNLALAKTGEGIYIFSPTGELLLRLNAPEYNRITALANGEAGVLWVATENGVEKVLYSSALTAFGQPLGITIGWPIVARWGSNLYAESDGKLYRAVEGKPGAPSLFQLWSKQPQTGIWALAASGSRMLVGGVDDVYLVTADGDLTHVAKVPDLAHLIMYDEDHCFAIGRKEICFLEWVDGAWTERVQRITGVSYPSVAHSVGKVVWLELAGEVGRLSLQAGKLVFDRTTNVSWTQTAWVNIGVIDNIVTLAGHPGERRFFDENTGKWIQSPRLTALLARSPYWIYRIQKDSSGTIWATHDEGVVRFTPRDDDYEIDINTFDFINDRYPQVHILPGDDIWIWASRSLYHVERDWAAVSRSTPHQPTLVSVVDNLGKELLPTNGWGASEIELPFRRNSLTFRFFSGSYAGRRPPVYEYRLFAHEPWTQLSGSELTFRGLHNGNYKLQVRFAGRSTAQTQVSSLNFEIFPPWYRSPLAYGLYCILAGLGLFGAIRWSSYIERSRNAVLERLVDERTHQLTEAMNRLNDETRNAAVLAERNRLANEIHDSVQQGLTGAILQLDTTLKLPDFAENLRARLDVVRNMISYARQEVQHAVWDMESPLLEGGALAPALRNLVTFINADSLAIDVTVKGEEVPLDRTTNHNLLRIAQEATTNAIRHSYAHHLNIILTYTDTSVQLTIQDDGVGFDPNNVLHHRTGHLGLRGIRTRVKKLRGQLTIDSKQDQGTALRIDVPLPVEANTEPI